MNSAITENMPTSTTDQNPDSRDVDSLNSVESSEFETPNRTVADMNVDAISKSSMDIEDDKVSNSHGVLRKPPMNGNQSPESSKAEESREELMRRRSASVLEVKEHAHSRLMEELLKAQEDLKLKDEAFQKVNSVHQTMAMELEDLTASLFEEANKMVQDANAKRAHTEKLLKEANAKVDVLQAEVTALKSLVITSTPSMPNKHLHPQLEPKKEQPHGTFVKGHRRSTSHHNISREIKISEILVPQIKTLPPKAVLDGLELDPNLFEMFKAWRRTPNLQPDDQFIKLVLRDDVMPCLFFSNKDLSKAVFDCVMKNTLTIEPLHDKHSFPSDDGQPAMCALTQRSQTCRFRIKLNDSKPYHFVSQLARNRVAAVCDFFTYVRYVCQGLVKTDDCEVYKEIMKLRKQMSLARLGYS